MKPASSAHALILFGHGARDPDWAQPMRRVQALLAAQHPELRVELAFLELMSPDLPACVAQLADEGYTGITIVPLFLARGAHLKRDVPILLAELQARWPSCDIKLAAPVGEQDEVLQAMADCAWRALPI